MTDQDTHSFLNDSVNITLYNWDSKWDLPCGSLFLYHFGKPPVIQYTIQLHIDLYIKIVIHNFYTEYVADRLVLGKCIEHYLRVISVRLDLPYITLCGDIPTPYGLTVSTHKAYIISIHTRDPPHILFLLTYEGLIRSNLDAVINRLRFGATQVSTEFAVNPKEFHITYNSKDVNFFTIFTYDITGIFGHRTILHMACMQCCDKYSPYLSINKIHMEYPEKVMLCDMSNGKDYFDGYRWQLIHKNSISYMVSSQSETVVIFKMWTEPLVSQMYTLSKEMTSLSFNINTNSTRGDVFYRKYTIQSDSFIKINFKHMKLSGYTYECNYGGIAILPSVADWQSMAGIYCTNETIYPLLGDIKEFYSNKHEVSLVLFSYTGYFHINITVAATRTDCEGWYSIYIKTFNYVEECSGS